MASVTKQGTSRGAAAVHAGPLHAPGASPEGAIHLIWRPRMGPLNIELTLMPHVYLLEAELVIQRGVHAEIVPIGLKTAQTAAWRQLAGEDAQAGTLGFSISWHAVATDAPGARYAATVTVRDSLCALLDAFPASINPSIAHGQIGPAGNPTDIGGVTILVKPG